MPVSKADLDFLAAVRRRDCAAVAKHLSQRRNLPKGALSTAASTGQMRLTNLLLSKKTFCQTELDYALHTAVENGRWIMAERLLASGGNHSARKGLTKTPLLSVVAGKGNLEFVQRLLALGADPNLYDVPWSAALLGTPIGRTVLMVAAEKGQVEIVRTLLKAGADPWLKGVENKTAYDLVAKRRGREPVAALLSEWMQKHPQTPASPPAPKVLDFKTPFASWDDAVRRLEQAASGKGAPHPQAKAVKRFPLSPDVAAAVAGEAGGKPLETYRNALATVQTLSAKLGTIWFLQFETVQGALLCGLPKADKWKVLGAFKTACANYGVTHAAMLKFLKALDAEQQFDLVECDFSSVGGHFRGKLSRPDKVAQRLFEFCPFVAEDAGGSVKRFANTLAKTGYFKIWWD
jgi:hypothetical protein